MTVHSDLISYRWTAIDRMAAAVNFPGKYITPYGIEPDSLTGAGDYKAGDVVTLSLGLSVNPPTIARFFREGYEWVDMPPDVPLPGTLAELFTALFAKDKVKFAHFDPLTASIETAAKDIANVANIVANPMSALDPTLMPLADLAQLHFEHWGNTDLRAAVISGTVRDVDLNVGIGTITLPWFGGDPLAAPLAALLPLTIPTQKDGAQITQVLAKKPLKGAPVKVPTLAPDAPAVKFVVVATTPPPEIELDGWSTQTLFPMRPGEWNLRASKIRFRVNLPLPALEVRFDILLKGKVHYSESHSLGEYLIPGLHIWQWDGFDKNGVLDTAVLKKGGLSARITVIDVAGRVGVAHTEMGTGPDSIRWVDAKIHTKTRKIEMAVYARFSNPSEVDLATFDLALPPAVSDIAAAASPVLSAIPGASSIPGLSDLSEIKKSIGIPSVLDLDKDTFGVFKTAIMAGIGKYWSRKVTIQGEPWEVTVTCNERTTDIVRTFLARPLPKALKDVGIGDGGYLPQQFGSRSVNLATLGEGLPIIDIWTATNTDPAAIDEAQYVGAHELGHSVLRDSKNFYYSLTHKGTSTAGQVTQPDAPMYPHDHSAEIDVMLYYNDKSSKPGDWPSRTHAVVEDVLGLVAMARLTFG